MIIEIYLSKPVEPVGDCATFYIETDNQEFIQELKKYVCPVRLIKYLDQELQNNEDILELISLEPEQRVDLKIDLSLASEKIINNPNLSPFPTKYLEQTKHLDKYGKNSIYNCKLIYTSNTNPGIKMYVNQEGKIEFGKEMIYFYDYKYDDYYSFRTSKVVSAKKKNNILTVETLNSTYIFELFKELEIPDYQVSKEFYEEHQKRMNAKSTKFLTKSIDGFINVIEVPKAMTKNEAIEYFKKNKIFIDYVLAPVTEEALKSFNLATKAEF